MAKKNKVQLTPEQLAEKKLGKKKVWARIGAVACAVAITAVVYVVGAKDGHQVKQIIEEPQTVIQTVTVPASKSDDTVTEPTTSAPATTEPTQTTTSTDSDSSDDSFDILGTITGLLGGLGDIDLSGAGDAIEGAGTSVKDFFYGVADKIESDEGIGDLGDGIGDTIGGIIGGDGSDSGLGDLGDLSGSLDDILGGIGA